MSLFPRERTQAEEQGEGEAEKFTFKYIEFEVYTQRNLRFYLGRPQRTLKKQLVLTLT